MEKSEVQNREARDFTGGPVVEDLPSHAWDVDLIPGRETKIPRAMKCSQKIKNIFFLKIRKSI